MIAPFTVAVNAGALAGDAASGPAGALTAREQIPKRAPTNKRVRKQRRSTKTTNVSEWEGVLKARFSCRTETLNAVVLVKLLVIRKVILKSKKHEKLNG